MGGLIRCHICGIDAHLAIFRYFIGIIDTGVTFDQPGSGLGIHPFTVPLLTDFNWSGNMHLDKASVSFDGFTYFRAGGRIRCNRGTDGNAAILCNLTGNEADTLDVDITMLF